MFEAIMFEIQMSAHIAALCEILLMCEIFQILLFDGADQHHTDSHGLITYNPWTNCKVWKYWKYYNFNNYFLQISFLHGCFIHLHLGRLVSWIINDHVSLNCVRRVQHRSWLSGELIKKIFGCFHNKYYFVKFCSLLTASTDLISPQDYKGLDLNAQLCVY